MSARYQVLRRSVAQLRAALLPRRFDPTGQYRNPRAVHLRTASFRVLSHAELESFLEDIAEALYTEAWNLWKVHSWPSHTLTCLLAFSDVQTFPPADSRSTQNINRYTHASVPLEKANSSWRHAVRRNHGIKEENVLRLFLPIGVDEQNLDQTLLNDLSSFGSSRGEVAHRSPNSVQSYLDPKTEFDTVQDLVRALEPLDAVVEQERRRLARVAKRLRVATVPRPGAAS